MHEGPQGAQEVRCLGALMLVHFSGPAPAAGACSSHEG